MKGTIAIAGSLAQKPGHGGHSWVFLQYLLGFKRLGWRVLFLDRLEPEMCHDQSGAQCELTNSFNLKYLDEVMRAYGLEDSYALLQGRDSRVGLPRRKVLERVRDAPFLLNVMGFLDDEEVLAAARKRVFLDIDPGFPQIWRALGLADLFKGHDQHVTIGLNMGHPECSIPTCGIDWITTAQPILLDRWPVCRSTKGAKITSVASWRGPYGPLEYKGRTYGLRVHEFRKFASLPATAGQPFELALGIDPSEKKDLALLAEYGWSLVDPLEAAGDPALYQSYIQRSKAEFMVAKNLYVDSGSGWFSDRSICYLASGKPVLAQDTGLGGHFPVREGLLLFSTLDDCCRAVEELDRNYQRHSAAARGVAEEFFDSDRVLNRLLTQLGAG